MSEQGPELGAERGTRRARREAERAAEQRNATQDASSDAEVLYGLHSTAANDETFIPEPVSAHSVASHDGPSLAADGYSTQQDMADQHPLQDHLLEDVHEDHHDVGSEYVPRTSKKVRRRRRNVVLTLVLAFVVVVAFFAFQAIRPLFSTTLAKDYPGPGTGSVTFVVDPGSTGRTVAAAMVQQDIVGSENAFLDALNAVNGNGNIQPGSFQMKKQMKASDAVSTILSPDNNKVHYAAIAQNLRQSDVLPLLAKSTGIALTQFQDLASKPSEFGLPAQAKSLEGYLAPGEYRFATDMTAKAILAQMVKATTDILVKNGVTDPNKQYQDLTIASILENEGNEANYAEISGAIENRLNNPNAETGGRLESDATVAYGLGVKTYEISDAQKKDASNPYNTFAKPGLPVGPIGSPKEPAILAAIHPTSNPYYFWVTVNLDTGETLFATTYADHQKNVAKYTAWCTANQGKCK